MKIIEDSNERLVLKEGAATKRVMGVLFLLIGIGLIVGGVVAMKLLIAFGAAFALIGLLLALLAKADVVAVDKTAKSVSVTYTSLKNRSGKTQTAQFADVSAVTLEQGYTTVRDPAMNQGGSGVSFGSAGMNGTQTQIQMNLAIQLRSGQTWTIANEQHQVNAGLGVSLNKLPAVGQKLADTLGVPFQQTGVQTASQTIKNVVNAVQGNQPNQQS